MTPSNNNQYTDIVLVSNNYLIDYSKEIVQSNKDYSNSVFSEIDNSNKNT